MVAVSAYHFSKKQLFEKLHTCIVSNLGFWKRDHLHKIMNVQ